MTSSIGPDLDRKVCLECHRQFTGIVAACTHDGSMLVPVAQDPLLGTKLAGKYDIIRVLGTGGMGVVYEGRQDVMDRRVAIKMLQAHHLNDSMSVKRFQQESKATCRLNHPHIITVFDFGISPTGQPYIVMDYLEGRPLSDIIREDGQVKVDRAVNIFHQACEALAHAHNQGVIHRDLKPSNIVLITYEGDKDYVKVVDFGVAKIMEEGGAEGQKLTQMGEVCGSPVYMSPEQCQGLPLDKRSDVYSMGIVMYETLTNRLPILGKTMVETMSKHIKEPPPPFSEVRPDLYIPERVEQVILRALAKTPEARQQSMEQLATELEMAIPKPGRSVTLRTVDLSTETTEDQQEKTPTLMARLTPVQWAIALVLAFGIGTAGLYYTFSYFAASSSSKSAEKPSVKPAPTAVTPPDKEEKASTSTVKPPEKETTPPEPVKTAPPPVVTESQPDPAPRPKPKPKPKPRPAPAPKAVSVSKPAPKKPANDPFEALRRSKSF